MGSREKGHLWRTHRKFKINIPWNETAQPQKFLISAFMYLWAIYIFPRLFRLFCCIAFAVRVWEYINRSRIYECGIWDRGKAVSFLGIFVSNFRYSAFAVRGKNKRKIWFGKQNLEKQLNWRHLLTGLLVIYNMLSSPPRIEVYDDDGKQGRDNKDKLLGNHMPLFNKKHIFCEFKLSRCDLSFLFDFLNSKLLVSCRENSCHLFKYFRTFIFAGLSLT